MVHLALRAWTGVLDRTAEEVPDFVFDAFYPDGWRVRQRYDVGDLLDTEPHNVWVAQADRVVVGFIGLRVRPEDRMGEIAIIAVDPDHQRRGIAKRMMLFAEKHFSALGLSMVMVETIGGSAHLPARRIYETFGFEQWPVARYFKKL